MSSVVTLGELVTAAKVERAGDLDLPVLSMTRSGGLVPQESVFNKKVASRDLSKYRVVRPSQLVVGIHIDEGALGVSGDDQMGIVSPAYTLWDLPDSELLDPDYLHRYIRSPRAIGYFITNYRQTAERRGKIPRDKFLALQIPLPPPAEQKRIAGILDAADALRAKRRESLAQIDTLLQSTFLDMFGDPVTNPMGWGDSVTMGEVSYIASGLTKGRKLNGQATREVSYLAVVNVQDRHLVLDPLKRIQATENEIQRYRLKDSDLLMTEGGDPDKLGRGTLWRDEVHECIHQNHVFRVRLHDDRLQPVFLNWLVGSERGKRYFLRQAKQTTGIATINLTQLRKFPLLMPPLNLQHRFAAIVESVEQQKARQRAHLDELDTLFASLQSRAFTGNL